MTQVPGPDGEPIDLLDVEQKKAQRNTLKAVGAIKLRILDDFNRRMLDKDLDEHFEKVQKTAKKIFKQQVQTRREHNEKAIDEKIKTIKINLAREEMNDLQRGLEDIQKNEEKAAKRLAEIEAKKEADIKKRELEYKIRRDQILKFSQFKDQQELQSCQEYMKSIHSKHGRSEEQAKALLDDKIKMLQEHNEDILHKRQLLSERRFEEWMTD